MAENWVSGYEDWSGVVRPVGNYDSNASECYDKRDCIILECEVSDVYLIVFLI
jgi:hypothetical protein